MKIRSRKRKLIVNPFVSEQQRRACYAKRAAGEAGSWDCDEWSAATPKGKKLPKKKNVTTNLSRKALKLKKARQAGKSGPQGPTSRQVDPSGTLPLQRQMIERLRQQFARVSGAIAKYVGVEDSFGLGRNAAEHRVAAGPIQNYSPDQPRDHGRFAKAEGEAATLAKSIWRQGGFTYKPLGSKSPHDGFIVSLDRSAGWEHPVKEEQFKRDGKKITLEYLKTVRDALRRGELDPRTTHVGAWRDTKTGRVVLDVNEVYKSKKEALDAGRKRKQDAIFDLGKLEEIDLRAAPARNAREADRGGDGRGAGGPGGADDRGSGDWGVGESFSVEEYLKKGERIYNKGVNQDERQIHWGVSLGSQNAGQGEAGGGTTVPDRQSGGRRRNGSPSSAQGTQSQEAASWDGSRLDQTDLLSNAKDALGHGSEKRAGLVRVGDGHWQFTHSSGKQFVITKQGPRNFHVHEQNGPTPHHYGHAFDGASTLKEAIEYARPIENLSLADRISAAADATHTEPTPGQVEAGNYRKGRVTIQGIPVVIENPAGSTRTKYDADGNPKWSRVMQSHYGYISSTEAIDGDHVDVFVGPEPESDRVFVIDQMRLDGGLDEHKCMLGYPDEESAVAGYLANYPRDWKGLGRVREMSVEQFRRWLKLQPMDLSVNVEDVPLVGQLPSACGAAAAMMVGMKYGVGPKTQQEWAELVGTTEREGTHPFAIVAAMRRLGLRAEWRHRMSVRDLANETASGRPVICPVQSCSQGESPPRCGHWVVVTGAGIGGEVTFRDPQVDAGVSRMPSREWIANWRDVDADGNQFVRFGIAVGPLSMTEAERMSAEGLPGTVEYDPRTGEPVVNFNPDQPRDEKGRFGEGSGESRPHEKLSVFVQGGPVEVHKNPTGEMLRNWLRANGVDEEGNSRVTRLRSTTLRGLVDGPDVYVWDETDPLGLDIFHDEVGRRVGSMRPSSPEKDHLSLWMEKGQVRASSYGKKERDGTLDRWAKGNGIVANSFCPTGEGGGVDPSCSPSSSQKVEIGGELVEVVTNPTKDQISRWMKSEELPFLKGFADKRGAIHVWQDTEKGEGLTHDLVSRAMNRGAPFGNRFTITRSSSRPSWEPVIGTYLGLREGEDVKRWADRNGITVNTFCATGPSGGVDPTCSPGGSGGERTRAEWDAIGERAVRSGSLTPNEERAKDAYRQSKSFYEMQKLSRGQRPSAEHLVKFLLGMHGEDTKQHVANLDSAIAKSEISEPLTLHRGMVLGGIVDLEKVPGFDKSGQVIRDTGFVSTSLDHTVAERFADTPTRPSTSVIIKTSVPAGTHAVKMPRVEGKFDEAEVLLGRGSRFRVGRITVKDDGRKSGHRVYEVEAEYAGAEPPKLRLPVSNELVQNAAGSWPADRFVWSPGGFDVEEPTENAGDFEFHQDDAKVRAFQRWLRKQLASYVVGKTQDALWEAYIRRGFERGAGRAFDDVRKPYAKGYASDESTKDFYRGSKEEFLRSSFGRPVAVEKVKLMAGRAFDDLENVTKDMSTRMSRVLTDGLVEGKSPLEVAKEMTKVVDISLPRAEMIARTELIRVHAEGQLIALKQLGVQQVGVDVEFTATNDDKVCDECEALDGTVFDIDEAHGIIPVHPLCRCSFRPASKYFPTKNRRATRDRMWDYASREPAVPIQNVFCPTGEGGGVDATCLVSGFKQIDDPNSVIQVSSSVSSEERDALHRYKTEGYRYVNAIAAGQAAKLGRLQRDEGERNLPLVDSAMSKHVLSEDVETFRGVPAWNDSSFASKKVGDEFSYNIFTSVSTSKAVAERFLDTKSATLLVIRAPKGMHAIAANKYGEHNKDEKELVLDRRAHFRVVEPPTTIDRPRQKGQKVRSTLTKITVEAFYPTTSNLLTRNIEEDEDWLWLCTLGDPREPTQNVFCPTGHGGGVDATCSPEKSMADSAIKDKWVIRSGIRVGPPSNKPPEEMSEAEYNKLPMVYRGGGLRGEHVYVSNDPDSAAWHGSVTSYRLAPSAKVYADPETNEEMLVAGYKGGEINGHTSLFKLPSGSGIVRVSDLWPVSKPRRTDGATKNVFCPTGHGGGVDATCSPGGHGSGEGGHGEHDHGAHELEHGLHEAHQIHEAHEIHEALHGLGGHAAEHGAEAAAHEVAGHGAEAAAHGHEAVGEAMAEGHDVAHGLMDAGAVITAAYFAPALRGLTAGMQKVPGGKKCGEAIASLHDRMDAFAEKAVGGLKERYGAATASAILGSGAFLAASARNSAGLGPLGNLIPGQKLIGAIPLVAVAEVGKRLGLVGKDTHLEKGLQRVGSWIHAARTAAGKPVEWAGKAGLKGARAAGKATAAVGRVGGKIASEAQRVTGETMKYAFNEEYVWNGPEQVDPSVDVDAEARKLLGQLHQEMRLAVADEAGNLGDLNEWLKTGAGEDEG